jgi:SAM-dependent methyltransferase
MLKKYYNKTYQLSAKLYSSVAYKLFPGLFTKNLYQPIYGSEKTNNSTRSCDDRWGAISEYLDDSAESILDIGCNLGYFSFKSTEINKFVLGIEADDFYYSMCQVIKRQKRIPNCTFSNELLDLNIINQLPSFDNIYNFSVFHHWVKVFGYKTAIEMMKALSLKCNKRLFFETGQSNEIGTKWFEKLSFMGDKPEEWISKLLMDIGFTSVRIIGEFPTGLTNVDRQLFLAEK